MSSVFKFSSWCSCSILVLAIMSGRAAAQPQPTSPVAERTGFVDVSVLSDPVFRGGALGSRGAGMAAEFSTRGISVGGATWNADDEASIAFGAYTYSLEKLYLSTGAASVEHPGTSSALEAFVEVAGREEHLRFTPSAMIAFSEGGMIHSEFRASKDYVLAGITLSPFAELTVTDRLTEALELAVAQFGLDVSRSMTAKVFLSGHVSFLSRNKAYVGSGERRDLVEAGVTLTLVF